MSDPLDYLNDLTRWPDPPPMDDRWISKLSTACVWVSARDAEIARLRADVERMREALQIAAKVADEAYSEWDVDNNHRVGKLLKALSGKFDGYRADTDRITAALADTADKPNEGG